MNKVMTGLGYIFCFHILVCMIIVGSNLIGPQKGDIIISFGNLIVYEFLILGLVGIIVLFFYTIKSIAGD